MKKTKLEELSSLLPDKERKKLLKRIVGDQKKDDEEKTNEVVPVDIKKEEREKLIEEELKTVGLWTRIRIWFFRIFTGRDTHSIFIRIKLQQLKYTIRTKSYGIVNFDSKQFNPLFAQYLYDVYHKAYPLMPFFNAFITDKKFKQDAFAYIFESMVSKAKGNINDFIDFEEIESMFLDNRSVDEIKRVLFKKIQDYIKSFPLSIFQHIEEGIAPLLFLSKLVQFPFSTLFGHFKYTLTDSLDKKYPFFEPGAIMNMLGDLEKFYYALKLVHDVESVNNINKDLFWFYFLKNEESVSDEEKWNLVAEIKMNLNDLCNEVEKFTTKVYLLETIKFFKEDPYYRLIFRIPGVFLRTVYSLALQTRLLEELESTLVDIKEKIIKDKIEQIFKGKELIRLFYYQDSAIYNFAQYGLPFFSHIQSMTLLFNYVAHFYQTNIQETVNLVNTYILANNQKNQQRLNGYSSSLRELELTIKDFDKNLSPEDEDGKILANFKENISKTVSNKLQYISLINQINRNAGDILETGISALNGIQSILDEVLTYPVENIRLILRTLHYSQAQSNTLQQVIKKRNDNISDFLELLSHVLALENPA